MSLIKKLNDAISNQRIKAYKNLTKRLSINEIDNIRDDQGYSILHLAVIAKNSSVLQDLIHRKTNLKVTTNAGYTALHLAITNFDDKSIAVIENLLKHKIDIVAVNNRGETALDLLILNDVIVLEDKVQILKLLLENSPNINITKERFTILHTSAAKGYKEIIELLIDKVDINLKDDDGFTMLHLAVINNHSRVVELLLTHNANAHILAPGKMDILQIAVRKSYFETVNLLLKNNSSISGAVKELLINFANTIIDEEDSWTLTHISASRGYAEIIKLLLDNNIDITVRDNAGNTPLHLSAESGCITITKYFIAKGANIKLPNSVGDTPLHLAIYSENYNYTVISILVKRNTYKYT